MIRKSRRHTLEYRYSNDLITHQSILSYYSIYFSAKNILSTKTFSLGIPRQRIVQNVAVQSDTKYSASIEINRSKYSLKIVKNNNVKLLI